MSNFTFDFDLADDLDDQFDLVQDSTAATIEASSPSTIHQDIPEAYDNSEEVSMTELVRRHLDSIVNPNSHPVYSALPVSKVQLSSLPDSISYSPLSIRLTSSPSSAIKNSESPQSIALARRDLFDARLQLISSSTEENENEEGRANGLEFIEAPSDLVSGVYEGGLKTWECSMDLVDYLHGQIHGGEDEKKATEFVKGKRILEIGCGTAVPSLYLMTEAFATAASQSNPSSTEIQSDTHFHLQDYNRSVLELVTLPNIILAWYMSPLSASYRATATVEEDEEGNAQNPSPSSPGELTLTPELLTAFQTSLSNHRIHLRFFTGSWDGFDVPSLWQSFSNTRRPYYDIVLTSETIYRAESLPALLRVLRSALTIQDEQSLEERAAGLSLVEPGDGREGMCLVAAKVLYFGVGGGVQDFIKAVEEDEKVGKGKVETVWERKEGVGRQIVQVRW